MPVQATGAIDTTGQGLPYRISANAVLTGAFQIIYTVNSARWFTLQNGTITNTTSGGVGVHVCYVPPNGTPNSTNAIAWFTLVPGFQTISFDGARQLAPGWSIQAFGDVANALNIAVSGIEEYAIGTTPVPIGPPPPAPSPAPQLFGTNTAFPSAVAATVAIVGVPSGATVVVSSGNGAPQAVPGIVSVPALVWTQVALENAIGRGPAVLYVAKFAAGGNLSATVTWSATGGKTGASMLAFTNTETVPLGTSVHANGAGWAPSLIITTTKANSLVIACNSDGAAIGGPPTYLSVPVSQVENDDNAPDCHEYCWFKNVVAAGAVTMGLSAPAGQNSSIILYEVRGP